LPPAAVWSLREGNPSGAESATGLVVYLRTSVDQQLPSVPRKTGKTPVCCSMRDPEEGLARSHGAAYPPFYRRDKRNVTIGYRSARAKVVVNTISSRLQAR